MVNGTPANLVEMRSSAAVWASKLSSNVFFQADALHALLCPCDSSCFRGSCYIDASILAAARDDGLIDWSRAPSSGHGSRHTHL